MKITRKNIILGICAILILWILSGIITYFIFSENRGEIGDMFGSINALFSGLALFGIIISILIQQNELNLQRKELTETREEFKINRLTNILFKQIEYLNSIIDNSRFAATKINLIEFIKHINNIKNENNDDKLKDILGKESSTIFGLITTTCSLIENFENVLKESNINEHEMSQLKSIFSNNISPFFIKLLLLQIKNIEKPLSTDPEFKSIEDGIYLIQLNKIKYILEFK